MDVALFVTCLTDQFYPRVGRAVVAVLEKLGCRVRFPAEQTCCGQPMYNNGYFDEAGDLARRMIDVFADAETVVTPSGSCCAMVHEQYPRLLSDDPQWARRCEAMVNKTHEFVAFLVHELKVDLRELGCRWEGHATFHYSCHGRGIGLTDEAVRLMNQIEGLQYTPMEKMDQCCGFGGTFAVKFGAVSGAMAADKAACITATDAPVCICNDGGCAMNIAGQLHRNGSPVRVMHLAEVIAEGLGLLENDQEPITHGKGLS